MCTSTCIQFVKVFVEYARIYEGDVLLGTCNRRVFVCLFVCMNACMYVCVSSSICSFHCKIFRSDLCLPLPVAKKEVLSQSHSADFVPKTITHTPSFSLAALMATSR